MVERRRNHTPVKAENNRGRCVRWTGVFNGTTLVITPKSESVSSHSPSWQRCERGRAPHKDAVITEVFLCAVKALAPCGVGTDVSSSDIPPIFTSHPTKQAKKKKREKRKNSGMKERKRKKEKRKKSQSMFEHTGLRLCFSWSALCWLLPSGS